MQPPSVQQPIPPYPIVFADGHVRSVAFFPDGSGIVTAGHYDNSTRIWDLQTGQQDGQPLLGHSHHSICVAVSKRGTDIVTGGLDNKVFLWDVGNRQAGRVLFADPSEGSICTVGFNSTVPPTLVASGGSNRVISIWKVKPDMDQTPFNSISVSDSAISSIQFSPGYPNLIAVASHDKKVQIYDAYNGQKKACFDGHTSFISSLTWFPGGQRIVSGGDKSVWIWDSRTGRPIDAPLLGHEKLVKSVSISPQGRFVASGSNDRTLRLWNAATRQQIGSPITHSDPVNLVAFSPDGTALLSVTNKGQGFLWDTKYLEVEEGLQSTRGVIEDLVSFSADAREEIRELIEIEFKNTSEEHAEAFKDQRLRFEEKAAEHEGRFNNLQNLLSEVKSDQERQFSMLMIVLEGITHKQEKQANDLDRAISGIRDENKNEFQALRDAHSELSSRQDAKFVDIQKKLNDVQRELKVLQTQITNLSTTMTSRKN
ncbi:WD40-repeat-containing domain protein [Gymnopilus junonius]|uniref:WD40-repeat-containing domain protein n=1 Tax=Gymnopilus junonius TaxID=109634 RepID=A0A9P5NIE8_GYMJU|nr:WD40-repeat-containing domain protein [Gymnopilus junonius]